MMRPVGAQLLAVGLPFRTKVEGFVPIRTLYELAYVQSSQSRVVDIGIQCEELAGDNEVLVGAMGLGHPVVKLQTELEELLPQLKATTFQ